MEFASKSHGQVHYLTPQLGNNPTVPGLKRFASIKSPRKTTPEPGSYNVSDNAMTSAYPGKNSSDLSRESIDTPLLKGQGENRSYN